MANATKKETKKLSAVTLTLSADEARNLRRTLGKTVEGYDIYQALGKILDERLNVSGNLIKSVVAEAKFEKSSSIVLEINEEEAQFLKDVFGLIGGDPEKSRRNYADSLSSTLSGAGVFWKGTADDISDFAKSIHFKDKK
jgi:hypothetical protein